MTTTSPNQAAPTGAGAAVALVATLAATYVVSQLLRNSIAVIAPDLAAELSMSASELGLLSSVYFFAFAAMQLPLGIAMDRWGPKICMVACAGVVVAASVMFALAHAPGPLILARALMGVGTSCYLMAPLALYARRFPPERFAMLAGLQMGFGSIGTLLATAPLAWTAATLGWRAAFLGVAAAMAVFGVLLVSVVKEPPARAPAGRRETLRESIAGIRAAMRTPSVSLLFVMHMVTHSSFVLVVGLWGGPYLSHVYGYGLTERGSLLLLAAFGQLIGQIVFGFSDRPFGSYKPPVVFGALATAAGFGVIAVLGILPPAALALWFAAFGFFASYTPAVISHGKSLFPPHLVGRGMTWLNMGTMGGAFIVQLLSGFVIDLFAATGGVYPLVAYRTVFALQGLLVLIAVVAYLPSRDPSRNARQP